ncbi:molybdate ABC transporter substrate-binding protein [Salisediminibacterium selenitireducens]|uniref:Molybdenum ABC transporter, periplasmic molybdate-binding protein n=1 Tax=Bacillus selenitireducens (strain ATCC 700615 / DSM 15326 / MLS10) TaxID=439292 RepID=D6XWN1_BACIE|nr:molybdate ABC transporter substrate-binding protein [Salisediminibacterium selenitireducens]ADH97873.1 molybdenum ABC transporter, periplasmic molybdate-binding protein [[Bacillus] selenitireducens MLS10]
MNMSNKGAFIILAFGSMLVAACGNDNDIEKHTLSVAAASDLGPAFRELAENFEADHGISLSFSFGSTGQLADQIENGAPFDVFASANVSFIERLVESGDIIEESTTPYAFGRIGLMMQATDEGIADDLYDLTSPDINRISIANPAHAPYGMAAEDALITSGMLDEVEDKLIYGRNITDAFVQIETGNAEVGIIAYSLGRANEDNFHFILLDEDLHEPIEQVIGVVSYSEHQDAGQAFIDYIIHGEGKETMEHFGFYVPEE